MGKLKDSAAEKLIDSAAENDFDHADSIDTDAIVLGKRGSSAAASDMLGSTTERVIGSADTTVVSGAS